MGLLYLYLHLLTASAEGVQAVIRGAWFNIPLSTHRHLCLPNAIFPSGFPQAVLFKDFIVIVVPIKEEYEDIK